MTNFQRSYSRVWWANDNNNDDGGGGSQVSESPLPHEIYYYGPQSLGKLGNIAEEASYRVSQIRRSVRSHDSGFNDSDHSPNSTSSSSQISAHNHDLDNNDENQNYLSPKPHNVSGSLDRSPSIANETVKTPPTVIRRKISSMFTPTARRISFSAPSTPDAIEPPRLNSSFRSLDSFSTKKSKERNGKNEQLNSSLTTSLNDSRAKNCSLRRGKTISPSNNSSYRRRANRRRLLDCVSQVSGSTSDVYTLASDSLNEKEIKEQPEEYHHYETVSEVKNTSRANIETEIESTERTENTTAEYNNETVTFGSGDETVTPKKDNDEMVQVQREKLPLPTYDELYPPNGCSTPMLKPKIKNVSHVADHTQSSIIAINGASQYEQREQVQHNDRRDFYNDDSDFNLSLAPNMNWESCTYIEYTNPALNGHACSVQFWLDETRTMYYHEIMSTLQTKSILYEAARSLKLNPPIAAKLIHQIQLKGIAIETKFDEIDRIFESHAKLVKRLQRHSLISSNGIDESIEIADNEFKEKISVMMKSLTENVCHFMSRLNSKIIFQNVDWCTNGENGKDLRHFERNVKTVIDLCQDLRVACETKIDDIETNVLLKDFYTLKQSVLKAIRKVFRRLMNIIVCRVEENPNEMLLRANINVIATLPTESVYNSSERFSSLNDAFITSGVLRVLLMICLDADKISIRAMALRALTTICSSAEMIRQFIEIGGLDVVTDILTDYKRNDAKYEPELREAVSVLTQVTAPWIQGDSGNIDDLLKLSIDNLVTRLTQIIESTDCLQTLMLAAACLNNLSRKSSLAFYSLMDNRSVHQLIHACDGYQQRIDFGSSAIFLYEQITSMLFNMAGNKKCHQHLAHKEIIYFVSFVFQTQFHMKYVSAAEKTALRKTIKNILHIFARLIHHSAVGQEILEQNAIPIFSRVEQHIRIDDVYAKDLQYINKKLNKSLDTSDPQISSKTQHRLSVCNMTGSSLLESYV
ncbi:uncharacterized protein LOC129565401 [Sitodiplosis mosellana]|uniref:uncharacterized protein LOC129565401 n=1 Tax=Sitodiplosis mosellana TaxID=263140 RepID=UPI002443E47B|nr:uncharacterized protein LOC129565401 [Sitodiplosis mosellana]